jgi:hypothetical protein
MTGVEYERELVMGEMLTVTSFGAKNRARVAAFGKNYRQVDRKSSASVEIFFTCHSLLACCGIW